MQPAVLAQNLAVRGADNRTRVVGDVGFQEIRHLHLADKADALAVFFRGVGKFGVRGEHRGLHYYTIGQRRGIRIPSNTDDKAYVVTGKRASDHALLVAFDGPDAPGLWTDECRVHSLSFIGEPVTTPRRLEGKVRYRDPRVFIEFSPVGRVVPDEPGTAHLKFEQPQRALASGQILALYDGEKLLGGGFFL